MWGFERFGTYLIEGRVDRWLLRPRGVILQIGADWFELRKLGRIAQGVLVLGIAVWQAQFRVVHIELQ